VQVRRATGIRYVARVVERGHVHDVPGGARATRAEAERALEIALAITRGFASRFSVARGL
jgi:hypothetical protein